MHSLYINTIEHSYKENVYNSKCIEFIKVPRTSENINISLYNLIYFHLINDSLPHLFTPP